MGIFNRGKKKAAAEAAEKERLAQIAAEEKAAAEASAAQRHVEVERSKEDKGLTAITAKRKDIAQLERALQRFEDERKTAGQAAIRARQNKKDAEMKSHLRNATRLKKRIEQYTNQVNLAQQQLDTLEDAMLHRQNFKETKAFKDDVTEMKLDAEEVDTAIQDMREAIESVNEVTLTVQADSELNKNAYDIDTEAALDDLEAEFAEEATDAIPNVPGEVPKMPSVSTAGPATVAAGAAVAPAAVAPAASSSLNQSEEEEMRRLEAEIAL